MCSGPKHFVKLLKYFYILQCSCQWKTVPLWHTKNSSTYNNADDRSWGMGKERKPQSWKMRCWVGLPWGGHWPHDSCWLSCAHSLSWGVAWWLRWDSHTAHCPGSLSQVCLPVHTPVASSPPFLTVSLLLFKQRQVLAWSKSPCARAFWTPEKGATNRVNRANGHLFNATDRLQGFPCLPHSTLSGKHRVWTVLAQLHCSTFNVLQWAGQWEATGPSYGSSVTPEYIVPMRMTESLLHTSCTEVPQGSRLICLPVLEVFGIGPNTSHAGKHGWLWSMY
jgi:hypothetical protein